MQRMLPRVAMLAALVWHAKVNRSLQASLHFPSRLGGKVVPSINTPYLPVSRFPVPASSFDVSSALLCLYYSSGRCLKEESSS
jgi:hypothetical protein